MGYKYRSGVNANTTRNLMIGPGAIFRGFVDPNNFGTLLGATSGGNTINMETEWHVPEIDGVLGPLKGGRWLTSASATLETNLLEVTKENLMLKFPSFKQSNYNKDYTKIHHEGEIAPTSYDTIAIVGEITGKDLPVIFVLENAAVTDAAEIPLGNGQDDVVLATTWEGHYDPENPTKIPFYILYPETGSPITPPVVFEDVIGLAATDVTANSMTLTWKNPNDSNFLSVDIMVNGSLVASNVAGTTYDLTGLAADTLYTIKVIAKYIDGVAAGVEIQKTTSADQK